MRLPVRPLIATLAALLLAAATPAAHALVINLHFAQPGERSVIDFRGRFSSPGRVNGGGSVEAVFQAAAQMWQSVLRDDRTFNITVGWTANFTLSTIAGAASVSDSFNEIALNARLPMFGDPTPLLNEEFGGFTEILADLGGGSLVTGRGFTEGPDALGLDLLSTALHEIGHVLGNPFDRVAIGRELVVADGPFAGTHLPCFDNHDFGQCGHLSFALAGALMNPSGGLPLFGRTLISDADLAFVAQDGRFHDVDFDGVAGVPLPGTLALAAAALALLPARRRSRLH